MANLKPDQDSRARGGAGRGLGWRLVAGGRGLSQLPFKRVKSRSGPALRSWCGRVAWEPGPAVCPPGRGDLGHSGSHSPLPGQRGGSSGPWAACLLPLGPPVPGGPASSAALLPACLGGPCVLNRGCDLTRTKAEGPGPGR